MKYRFDDEGVSMSWGILFRREINLTYRRIQDIHLTSNSIERWLGLSKLAIQTASGSATAEMTIEGVLEAQALRDYLYTKMRGARGHVEAAAPASAPLEDEALALLRDIRDEVRTLRAKLEARS
jgi:putative membrane protein